MTSVVVERVAVSVGAALLVFGSAALHVRARGEAAITASDQALAAGDVPMAIAWARDAAMSVAPGSPYSAAGYARLTAAAERAEVHGDLEQATDAWRAVLVAAKASDSESTHRELTETARRALVRLAGRRCEGDEVRAPASCENAAADALAVDPLPSSARLQTFAAGAVLFALGVLGAARLRLPRPRLASVFVIASGVAVAALALAVR